MPLPTIEEFLGCCSIKEQDIEGGKPAPGCNAASQLQGETVPAETPAPPYFRADRRAAGITPGAAPTDVQAASAFFNQEMREPAYILQAEQPQHRAICILAAQGFTSTEIAEQTGFTTVTINYVKKQPWALKYIAETQERYGKKAVMSVLQGAALECARVLVRTMQGGIEGREAVNRGRAANAILDRLFGSAPQLVMHQRIEASELSDEELATTAQTGTTPSGSA